MSKVNVLVVTPMYRPTYIWYGSVMRQEYNLGKLDFLMMHQGYPNYNDRGIQQIVDKLNVARNHCLSGNYDYMVTIEDDNVLLRNTDLQTLVQTAIEYEADVMYSPYIFRNAGNLSSCAIALDQDRAYYYTAEKFTDNYTHWLTEGSVIPSDGLGFGFTCISRKCLIDITFRTQTVEEKELSGFVSHSDTTFAMDCLRLGKSSYTHFGVPNGHIHFDADSCFIMIPDASATGFIRKEYINV